MSANPPRPTIAPRLRSLDELNRACSIADSDLTTRVAALESARTLALYVDSYDQVADDRDSAAPGAQPLDAASNYAPGKYYTLSVDGAFATALPELAGQDGRSGDEIISDGAAWWIRRASF